MGDIIAERDPNKTVSLEELMVSTLAMTDALSKLLTAKGVITEDEFKTQLSAERATYISILKQLQ